MLEVATSAPASFSASSLVVSLLELGGMGGTPYDSVCCIFFAMLESLV